MAVASLDIETPPETPVASGPALRRVLVIGMRRSEVGVILPLLLRVSFDVDRLLRGRGALALLAQTRFDLLLVRHALVDMEVAELLEQVRLEGSANRDSALVLLAGAAEEERRARLLLGRGASQVLRFDSAARGFLESISRLVHVAPRKAARVPTRLEVKLGEGRAIEIGMTRNVCATGMLVETDLALDRGARVHFEFMMGHRPVAGIAEVVRRTVPERERVVGFGMRFVAFRGDSKHRFQNYLGRL